MASAEILGEGLETVSFLQMAGAESIIQTEGSIYIPGVGAIYLKLKSPIEALSHTTNSPEEVDQHLSLDHELDVW